MTDTVSLPTDAESFTRYKAYVRNTVQAKINAEAKTPLVSTFKREVKRMIANRQYEETQASKAMMKKLKA